MRGVFEIAIIYPSMYYSWTSLTPPPPPPPSHWQKDQKKTTIWLKSESSAVISMVHSSLHPLKAEPTFFGKTGSETPPNKKYTCLYKQTNKQNQLKHTKAHVWSTNLTRQLTRSRPTTSTSTTPLWPSWASGQGVVVRACEILLHLWEVVLVVQNQKSPRRSDSSLGDRPVRCILWGEEVRSWEMSVSDFCWKSWIHWPPLNNDPIWHLSVSDFDENPQKKTPMQCCSWCIDIYTIFYMFYLKWALIYHLVDSKVPSVASFLRLCLKSKCPQIREPKHW